MDIFDAVASRYSCRAFLPTPVPEATVRDILERAARAPSGGNVQPWRVHALAGTKLEELRAIVHSRLDELPRFEGAEYDIYPRDLKQPYESRRQRSGVMLYQSIGVMREDRAGRYRQYARNFLFYDAPVGLFFSIDRSMGPPQWSDLGGYIQTVMLLARGHGLHACAQEAWTHLHKTVPLFIGLSPSTLCSAAWPWATPTRRRRSIHGARRAKRSIIMRRLWASTASPQVISALLNFCVQPAFTGARLGSRPCRSSDTSFPCSSRACWQRRRGRRAAAACLPDQGRAARRGRRAPRYPAGRGGQDPACAWPPRRTGARPAVPARRKSCLRADTIARAVAK